MENHEKNDMLNSHNSKKEKAEKSFSGILLFFLILFAMFFLIICVFPLAGDWFWTEGWIFIGLFTSYFIISLIILNKKNPEVLINRMKFKKEEVITHDESKEASGSDKFILPLLAILFAFLMIISDLDHRFNWSGQFPLWLEIIGIFLIGVGLLIMHKVTLQNAYASKILDIQEDQKIIDTGLYAHVRHPLYSGSIGMFIGIPLLLGSWWGIIPGILCIFLLVRRIKYEEQMLLKELLGYKEYQKKVKYKLIPKIY